jgi:hypothetical protein
LKFARLLASQSTDPKADIFANLSERVMKVMRIVLLNKTSHKDKFLKVESIF